MTANSEGCDVSLASNTGSEDTDPNRGEEGRIKRDRGDIEQSKRIPGIQEADTMSSDDESPISCRSRTDSSSTNKSSSSFEKITSKEHLSFFQRCAVSMAASPCTWFWVALLLSLALSVIGMVGGNFSPEVDNHGW